MKGRVEMLASPSCGIETTEDTDGLVAIRQRETQLVIWQRSLSRSLSDWIDKLDPLDLPHLRLLVRPTDLRAALTPLLDEGGLPAGDMRDLLIDDIEHLVGTFARIASSDHVDVRLERIEHDACWKFHRDMVELRLLTTYRGATTEWVPMAQAETAIAQQKGYDGPLHRLGLQHVALFKGDGAGGPSSGIVHRSPPIAGTGQSRMFLCLNTRTIVSPDPWTRP